MGSPVISVRRIGSALAVFLLLAVLHTWPLVTALHEYSRDNDDERLNTWAVSWIAHQLPRDPLHLFDGNIFYPSRYTLAYSEPLIIPGLMGAPLRWLGASPVLTYNVLVLSGLALTAFAMYVLVTRWTGDHYAGLLSGALLAFSTQLLTRLSHLQILHLYWLPLAILALDGLLTHKRPRHFAMVGLCVLGSALTSGYLAMFVTVALGAAFLARVDAWYGQDGVKTLARLAVAAAMTLVILVVVLWPYGVLRREEGLLRPLVPEVETVGLALQSYLSTAARVHYSTWSEDFYERTPASLFPTAIGLGLGTFALLTRRRVAPKGVRRVVVAIACAGVLLSLGPLTPVYAWAYQIIPPLQGIRATGRFGVLVIFSVAVAAGLGLAAVRRRTPQRWVAPLSIAALVVATVETFSGPIPYRRLDWNPPIYRALEAIHEPGALLELPIYAGGSFFENGRYVLSSTTHWRPLVNGYSGYRPPNFDRLAQLVGTFPSLLAVARLRSLDVRYVVLHTSQYRRQNAIRQTVQRLDGRPDLVLVAREGTDRLYRIGDPRLNGVDGLLAGLEWSELTFVDGPGIPGSLLRASQSLESVFGMQGRGQFFAHMENTRTGSRLLLRLPERMVGEFLDERGGRITGVAVDADRGSEQPTVLSVPPGHDAVLLVLRAEDNERVSQGGPGSR